MIFNMVGGSGGLNFEVVGNPKPTNPKENTIWINTDAEITGWVFSAGQPESPTEGLVWIELSVTSDVELNALKKNAIQIGLVNTSQYVSGAWVEKTAMIYQNGSWIPLLTEVYLFNNGAVNSALTGGWSGNGYSLQGLQCIPGGLDSSGELLYAQSGYLNANTRTHGVMGTVNAVDLTSYRTLSALVSTLKVGGFTKIYISTTKDVTASYVAMVDIAIDSVVNIDVSNLNGYYYIMFASDGSIDNTAYVRWMKLEA